MVLIRCHHDVVGVVLARAAVLIVCHRETKALVLEIADNVTSTVEKVREVLFQLRVTRRLVGVALPSVGCKAGPPEPPQVRQVQPLGTSENRHFCGLAGPGLLVTARETLTGALRRKKGWSGELLRALRCERALVYEEIGQRRRARSELEKLYAEAPDYEDVAARLGLLRTSKSTPSSHLRGCAVPCKEPAPRAVR
ncbi:MAG: hypothetical protein D6751_12970 [Deltaproteobacteria bacterium]|nr:MAG: hypothetical protein D6751_12970 [Deltaproteobacteria bacterium]